MLYEAKIRESIYGVTGHNDTSPDVVSFVEHDVRCYLTTIKRKFERQHLLRLQRKEGRSKKASIKDLYSALVGTPELYGVKRSIIVKTLSRKLSDDNDAETSADLSVTETYQSQLESLNDGTSSFQDFEQTRLSDLQQADQLTRRMTCKEYLVYSKKGKTQFVGQPRLFCTWLGWDTRPPPVVLAAFGWLGTYRVKRIVRKALERANDSLHLTVADFE